MGMKCTLYSCYGESEVVSEEENVLGTLAPVQHRQLAKNGALILL